MYILHPNELDSAEQSIMKLQDAMELRNAELSGKQHPVRLPARSSLLRNLRPICAASPSSGE